MPFFVSSRSARPIRSSNLRMPSCAMILRASSATKKKKLTTCSGLPANFLRSTGSCVATPTGQVLRWHLRIMMQPSTTSGAVAKPNSSAPSSAPITTSRPVFIWPSACTRMRPRRRFSTSVCCVSARPSSHGVPACLIERPRRRAGAAVVAGDHHVVGLGLGHAGGDRADADLADQLDADAGARVGVLQVVDQLRQVLDRVDVVVRRRRDQADARHRVAQHADVLADLAAGQLAALAGLGALRHLDLDLVGRDQVLGRHAEAARGHLLDLAAQRVAGLQLVVGLDHLAADHVADLRALRDRDALQLVAVARRVFAALAGVALAADAVHRHRERRVRLGGDRAERHRAGGEALDDLGRRLDLVERDRLAPGRP